MEETIEILCKISINAFTIYNHLDEPMGLGVYIPSNFINHCCEPNAHILFAGRTQRIFALKEIEKNSEITISYSQMLSSRESNRKFLKENYLFDCKCGKCEGDMQIPERVFEILEIISSKKADTIEKNQCWQEIINNYKGLPREYYGKALSELSLQYINDKDYKKAYGILKQFIECCEGKITTYEPEIGWKYAELAKLGKYLGKLKESIIYGEKSLGILMKYYKVSDEIWELKELETNLREMQDLVRANQYFI